MVGKLGQITLSAILCLGVACNGDDNGNGGGDPGTTGDPGASGDGQPTGDGDAGAGDPWVNPGDEATVAECERQANLQHAAALIASQPSLEVRSKSVITVTTTFASVAGEPTVRCDVELEFRDANGNGTLEAYEDWTRTAGERAADLLTRMSDDQKIGLMAHPTTPDAPTFGDSAVSTELQAMITSHIRFGRISYNGGPAIQRATWANNVQELCEATALGIPFVISQAPSHTIDNGRTKAAAYSLWPYELGLGADGSLARAETFGQVVSRDFRAVGARMALGIPADLATDPRWYGTQFTFGEDSASVSALAGAYIAGLQGASLGAQSVAAVVGHFPGAGARQDGWDGRLAKGKYLTYPGDNIDAHLAAFSGAFDAGVAAVMSAYGITETGSWSGLDGLLDGTTIEQVGASFSDTLINGALRGHYLFDGLVLAPWGVLEAAGVDPLGAPWGVEALSQAERVAAAINAGVDQFGGLPDTAPIATALGNSDINAADIDTAAGHALVLMFDLGLFEDPYVDPSAAPGILIDSASTAAALASMNRSTVLLLNEDKPASFLNGNGDGTQTGDPGNAGNGSGKVLPAPPGQVYVTPGCSFYMMGNVDWDFVLENSAGYGELTNYATSIAGCGDVSTPEEKIACSNYVFVIVAAPYTADPDSGPLLLAEQSLEYASNANAAVLDDVALARSAIDAAGSDTQLIVAIDAGRPAVISEIMTYAPAALLISWGASTKSFLDVVFGISSGLGTLPVGLPLSDAAAATQLEDVAGDGQHATFVRGFGLELQPF